MLILRTFGGLALEKQGKPGTGAAGQRVPLAILAFIATAGETGASRDRITALFWPERDTERARGSLKQAFYSLRRDAGEQELTVGTTTLRLNPDVIRTDVGDFQAGLARQDLTAAVEIYSGLFLDGIHLGANAEFERWLDKERSLLEQKYTAALETLARRAEAESDFTAAVEWWRRLAATDVLSARFARGYIQALANGGDRDAAIKHAHVYETIVRSELGVEPDASIARLIDDLGSKSYSPGPALVPPLKPGSSAGDVMTLLAVTDSTPVIDTRARNVRRPVTARRFAAAVVIGAAIGIAIIGWKWAHDGISLEALGIGQRTTLISQGTLQQHERLLVADFTVHGADSALGSALAAAARIALDQSKAISIMPAPAVFDALKRMQKPISHALDLETAREIAAREGIKGIVYGEVTSVGGRYLLMMRLVSPDSGSTLTAAKMTVNAAPDLIPAVDKVSRRLRSSIGESLRYINATPPLEKVTTPSLEALRKYTDGVRAGAVDYDAPRAFQLLQEAVTLDTGFALAWRALWAQGANNRIGPAFMDSAIVRAYRHRDRLSDRERDQVMASYYWISPHRDRAMAARAYEAIAQKDTAYYSTILGIIYFMRRDFARAEVEFRKLIDRYPNRLLPYDNLIHTLFNQGKVTEAQALIADARKRFPSSSVPAEMQIRMLQRTGRVDAYKRALDSVMNAPGSDLRNYAAEALAFLALERGQLAEYERVQRYARGTGTVPAGIPAIVDSVEYAWVDAVLGGKREQAVQRLDAARSLYHSPPPAANQWYLQVAIAYAHASRPDKARAMLADYRAVVTDTAMLRWQRPNVESVLGEIALAEKRFDEAVAQFRQADVLPDGPFGCPICLPLALARTYDAAGKADSAILMYERYVRIPFFNRSGQLTWDPLFRARAHERLGQLYEASGDRRRAIAHYTQFVARWEFADAALQPRVTEARRRMRSLRGELQ